MYSNNTKKNIINIITLGCPKNIYDSEILMGQLKNENQIVLHEDKCNNFYDIVIINTCGFIENAKKESIKTILECIKKKKSGFIKKLFIMGCFSERYKFILKKEIPEIDEYFGSNNLKLILKKIGSFYKKELIGERVLTTPNHFGYLKISDGCNRKCSFCAIPLMRGKYKSKSIDLLIYEATKLAKLGVKELILIAQDITNYGLDIYKKKSLGFLLKSLVKIEGIKWIRLHYAFPSNFPEEVLDIMANEKKICKYLDIPFQHISDSVLKSMRRGITKNQINLLIEKIRKKIPDIALRTTLIVGYPKEKEKDFEELKIWVKEIRFDRLGCFIYSHEENTKAFLLKDKITKKVKKERMLEIMKIQRKISFELNKKKIGNNILCIIDRKYGKKFIGRTIFDSPDIDNQIFILNNTNKQIHVGDIIYVNITSALEYDLIGKII